MIKYLDDKKETEKCNTLHITLHLYSSRWYERNAIILQRCGRADKQTSRRAGEQAPMQAGQ
jgi:hypothetical protein